MNISVKLFAQARELARTGEADLDWRDGLTVEAMLQQLIETYPELQSIRGSLLVAVDNEYVTAESTIPADAEVACFPPVSGG